MAHQILRVDGIKWWITTYVKGGGRVPVALCPDHDLKMTEHPKGKVYSSGRSRDRWASEALELECAEGPHYIKIPREFSKEKKYVLDRLDAQTFRSMQVIDLDGELTPIAKDKLQSKDGKYFISTQLMESKRGLQVVIYAGEKGKKQKTQIFVEPEIKRLAFDHKDLSPNDVFVELKATFDDGSSHIIDKGNK